MRLRFFVAFLLASSWFAQAQSGQGSSSSVDEVLSKLSQHSREYRAGLPALSCQESVVSEEVRHGQVRKTVKVEGVLREMRNPSNPDQFVERHNFQTVDGHPAPRQFKIPFFVEGGFANALGFANDKIAKCFMYDLVSVDGGARRRLDMALRKGAGEEECKPIPEGYKKSVFIDAEERIVRVERTISAEASKKLKEVYFVAADYQPQQLGGKTLWLPSRLFNQDAEDQRQMTATYSSCHLYTATVTIDPKEDAAR